MDAEILRTFLEEAESYLPTMRQGIIAYEQDPGLVAELLTSRRQAHTIKGAALMVELSEIGHIAKNLENDLKTIIQTKSVLTEQTAGEFLSRILILESYLTELRGELNDPPPEASKPLGEPFDVLQIDDSEELPFENVSESFEAATDSEDFEIDAEMLEIFAEEAEDLLRNISVNLGILEKTPHNRAALLEIRHSAHTLKGSGGIVGLKKLSALAHRVEDLLDYLADNEIESNAQTFELLLTATDCLEALARGEDSPEFNLKIERIYHSFDVVLSLLKAEKTPVVPASPVSQQSEIPEETEMSAPFDETAGEIELEIFETAESAPAETANPNRTVARVSLERLDYLFNLVGEMVISRSVFEQRLSELEQQIEELHHTTRRLRFSTGKLETDFEASAMDAQNSKFKVQTQFPGSSAAVQSSSLEFDTLEFDRYTEFHQTTRELVESASDTSAINSNLDNLFDRLKLLFDNQNRLIEGMQDNLLRLRMVSLNSLAPRLHRAVRVTAQDEGKSAELIIENEAVEIDTEILDAFIEPLVHLLRNAVAHGIEPAETRRLLGKPAKGTITLRAYSEGTHIVFVIADDGRGISISGLKEKAVQIGFISRREADQMSVEDAYSLIYLPGLSTSAQINQVSGRGVGMNIVKANITRRQGTISVKSEPQKGTTFTVRLPMSLAVTRALLVKAGAQTFAFSLNLVKQITEISQAELDQTEQGRFLTLGKTAYSFFHFNRLLNLAPVSAARDSKIPLLLLETLETPCALAVDRILKTEEIVIKPLNAALQNVPEIIGATILGDGSVVPVLDLVYLLKKNPLPGKEPALPVAKTKSETKVLIVDDSPSVRQVNSKLIKNAGWQAILAKDGVEALEVLQSLPELPEVILTDVEMPRMDGYELLASLKRQPALREIPVIMITSRAGDKHRRKAFDLGVDEYLTKPYEDTALINTIKNLSVHTDS